MDGEEGGRRIERREGGRDQGKFMTITIPFLL
jgi:hypothetical protein